MSLTIHQLNVKLQGEDILQDISLDIRDGEFISLLGASGCGKTTLLKSIAGLLEVDSGDIFIDGRSILGTAPQRRGTVIVFQDLRLFPHMTVEKNIRFAMELKKIPKKEQKETVKQLLEDVQLTGYENRKIREMSGGQMQRVALARAIAANPRILLLDEPFSGLDEKLRLEMGELVRKLHQEKNLTTVLVTHDKREALQMSDRIALMREGGLLQYDSPGEIFYHPVSKTVADYFGKANYIRGTVKEGRFVSRILKTGTKKDDGVYDALVRPFDIEINRESDDYTIQEIEFQGETANLKIETGQEPLICQLSGREIKALGLSAGDRTGVSINPAGIVFFKEE